MGRRTGFHADQTGCEAGKKPNDRRGRSSHNRFVCLIDAMNLEMFLARSSPIVAIPTMDSSIAGDPRRAPFWHFDAVSGRPPISWPPRSFRFDISILALATCSACAGGRSHSTEGSFISVDTPSFGPPKTQGAIATLHGIAISW